MTSVNCETLIVLDDGDLHQFIIPVKKIHDGNDVSNFLTSKAYRDITALLLLLNRSLFPQYNRSLTTGIQVWELGSSDIIFSDTIIRLRSLLHKLEKFIDEIPLDTGPRRFGNVSFRLWHETVEKHITQLLINYLPAIVLSFPHGPERSAIDELRAYFMGSFGSPQRLDYGTGHELSFLAFLGCIWKLGGFDITSSGDEERGIVFGVIDLYLRLIRRLIKTYTLEPAGSHGVWGLDDHSFLPYVFGSAQYGPAIGSKDPTPVEGSYEGAPDPGNVAKANLVEKERMKNFYFGAIGFIYDVKRGPFWEHSPTLYDISGIRAGWAKINKGMLKMYNAEVLSKFPVVQHFPFGSLFSWEQDPNTSPPVISIHTSSQPRNDTGSTTISTTTMRGLVNGGTKAPWASTNEVLPGLARETQAPRARREATASSINSKFSTTSARGAGSETESGQSPPVDAQTTVSTHAPRFSDSIEGDQRSMPPPTKAPWAK